MRNASNGHRVAIVRGGKFVLVILLLDGATAGADDWPHWRGPQRNDIVKEISGWKDGHWADEKPIWEAEVGQGSTSPLIIGDRLYVLGWEDGEDHVRCLEAKTGKSVWTVSYKCPQYARYATGDQGAYSGPTSSPEYDGTTGYLYTLSCDGDLNCWDTGAGGRKSGALTFTIALALGEGRPASWRITTCGTTATRRLLTSMANG